jgi:hypothetical protein
MLQLGRLVPAGVLSILPVSLQAPTGGLVEEAQAFPLLGEPTGHHAQKVLTVDVRDAHNCPGVGVGDHGHADQKRVKRPIWGATGRPDGRGEGPPIVVGHEHVERRFIEAPGLKGHPVLRALDESLELVHGPAAE